VLVGGRSFHEREEVLAISNARCAIEWPDDEQRVFATLRGPFFALGDDALLAYREGAKSLHPLRRGTEAEELGSAEQEVADALGILRKLHLRRNHRPIADTISRLLDAVRAHAGIAIWPTGEQALANCLRVIDQARRFESRGATSFRAFVLRMEGDAERADAEDAPVVEEGSEGVRIMTVHRAKGLEFPIVVLVDPTCASSRDQPSRHVDAERGLWAEPLCGCIPAELHEASEDELRRDAAEAVRVAYVAATRARELLVVPVIGDEELPGWLEVLREVVHPERAACRSATPVAGCPPFGEDSVLDRPRQAGPRPRHNVAPGGHLPRRGGHEVVWWDPSTLQLGIEEDVGLRQHKILEADEDGRVADAGERAHAQWQRAREAALLRGSTPAWRVHPVTSIVSAEATDAPGTSSGVLLERVQLDRSGRPGGKRFGSLVHAALAVVDLEADSAGVKAALRAQGRMIGASADELAAAQVAIEAALVHPILRRAARSHADGGLRRETPMLMCRADGSIVEGIVDLAFREVQDSGAGEGRWIVVDFKTDRELGARRSEYEAQVRLYAEGITAATGEATVPILLVV
jgi:ATP-dependent helicase/nuclease subunit A